MSDSGITQTSAQASRRQGSGESVGLWRDSPAAPTDGDIPVVALGRVEPNAQAAVEGSGKPDQTAPLHSPVGSFFHGPSTAGTADQRPAKGSHAASPQSGQVGSPTCADTGSDIAALLDFAVGLAPQPELEPERAAVDSEPVRLESAAAQIANTPAPAELRLPPRGHGVSATFESALGLGGGDSWYRPNDRSAHRPAVSLPSHQPVHERSTHV